MQEGPLSSNDLKTGSISQKVSPGQAGDRPLSTSSSTESVWGERQGTHWTHKHQGLLCMKTGSPCPASDQPRTTPRDQA